VAVGAKRPIASIDNREGGPASSIAKRAVILNVRRMRDEQPPFGSIVRERMLILKTEFHFTGIEPVHTSPALMPSSQTLSSLMRWSVSRAFQMDQHMGKDEP
jgi:hypothetical protein